MHRLQLTEVTSCISKCLSKKNILHIEMQGFSNLFLLINCSIDHFYLHRKSGEEVFRGPATMLGTLGPNLVERVWLRDMRQRPCLQGRSQEFVFFIIRGTNYTNLYKNLIKIQMFNINLGTIGGQAPARPPVSAPACLALKT